MKRLNTSSTDSAAEAPAAKLFCSSYHVRSVSRPIYGDRFIPSRSGSNFALFNLPNSTTANSSPSNSTDSAYIALLRSALLESPSPETPVSSGRFGSLSGEGGILQTSSSNGNIFKYKTETRMSLNSLSPFGSNDELPEVSQSPVKSPRMISKSPYKVLDAPSLHDDFYLNLVDWSSHNMVAVALGNSVYMWHASTGKVAKLCDLESENYVCSVGWQPCGTHLAVGTSDGKIQIWDASYCKRVRSMEGHRLRVGALAWSPTLLSSGSRDKSILQRDIRAQGDYVSKLNGHKSEVCGLKWSCDNRELASGGNDNRLNVWNQHSNQPVQKYNHTAAVKAIAWSPHVSGLLASGGGTADRCIRFWNTTKNSQLSSKDTGSQVCNLAWSKNVNELVSTHGYSQNEITVWKYPTMSKVATLTGHTCRVLYLATSPDGQSIVTGAGDETLRFWNVFPPPKSQSIATQLGAFSARRTMIR